MKKTYNTPLVLTRGDVVDVTLSGKSISNDEVGTSFRAPAGTNLSFGL